MHINVAYRVSHRVFSKERYNSSNHWQDYQAHRCLAPTPDIEMAAQPLTEKTFYSR